MVYLHLCVLLLLRKRVHFFVYIDRDHVPRSKMTMLPLNLMKHLFISSFHRRISSCYVYMFFFCFSGGEIYKINRHTYTNIIENTLMGDNKCMTICLYHVDLVIKITLNQHLRDHYVADAK